MRCQWGTLRKLQAQHALVASRADVQRGPLGPGRNAGGPFGCQCLRSSPNKPPAPGAFPKKELGPFEEKADTARTTLQDRRQAKCGEQARGTGSLRLSRRLPVGGRCATAGGGLLAVAPLSKAARAEPVWRAGTERRAASG